MSAVVFLGPTLPVAEARTVLDARYLPPAAQGDLTEAVMRYRPTVVGLVDGTFLQSLAVWHKEILFALDRGIRIFGASSMGALRAAETDTFGMEGIGTIYSWYASGELIDDDEVALAHGTPEDGYQKYSEPMVNLRATFAAAETAGLLTGQEREQLLAVAKRIYFADRTADRLFGDALDAGLDPAVLGRCRAFLAQHYVDRKRLDCLELLTAVGRALDEPAPPRPTWDFVRSTHFSTLYSRGRRVEHGGVAVPLEDIANYVALHDDEFDDLNFQALNRVLVGVFADYLGIEPAGAEIEAEVDRFRRSRGLADETAYTDWLRRNDLDATELWDLLALTAACRRIHRWYVMANWMERTAPTLLDELRLAGRYEQAADRAAAQEKLLQSRPDLDYRAPVGETLDQLWRSHAEWSDRSIPIPPREWAEEAGFHSADNLRAELKKTRTARQALLELLVGHAPDVVADVEG